LPVAATANNKGKRRVSSSDLTSGLDITEDQVALYLRNNPGFFLKRNDLLCELELAHPSGGAVSLLERQVSLLRERNMDMRSRLSSLLDNARDNDRLFEKTKKLVLSMLEAKSLDTLSSAFTRSLTQDFGLPFATVIVFGDPMAYRSRATRVVSIDEASSRIPGLIKSNNATCGVLRPEEFSFVFGKQADQVGSAAVVPLTNGHRMGLIAIGSDDPQYFRSSMGTLFLGYLGEVMIRLLPSFMQQGK
jgi:hypothetical protein